MHLLRRAKEKAAELGRTLASHIEEGLKAVMVDTKPIPQAVNACLSLKRRAALCRASI
jgi:hypothetical protein